MLHSILCIQCMKYRQHVIFMNMKWSKVVCQIVFEKTNESINNLYVSLLILEKHDCLSFYNHPDC